MLDKRQSEKKQLMEAVKKHKKGMKQQLEDMLSNVKRMGLDQVCNSYWRFGLRT